ncbi:asparagine synthase (glutamine-hydrolyzing) [Kamptonema cortianum]|nr:asparagine synthase (glutamine-hydrolyzing) [Kamptonema cortianum]
MCGIAGFLSARKTGYGRRLVEEIVASQFHRGPDFQAVEPIAVEEGELIFGHNRLSIIDLSAQAHQPIWDTAQEVSLVFNGEIYNYVELRTELRGHGIEFRTASDTEVLIEAYKFWGIDFLPRLNGMFAFALWDSRSQELLLVRDRFGVKPLSCYVDSSQIAFASTARCLAKHFGCRPNFSYLYKGVSTWNFDDDSELNAYDGLITVRPGSWIKCRTEANRLVVEKGNWYDLGGRTEFERELIADFSEQELADRVLQILSSACEIRLRADVPVAVALSGGLDSGAVATLASRMNGAVHAFSFGDPGDEDTEGPVAKRIADSCGIGITFIPAETRRVIRAFEKTLEAQDAPFVSVSQVAQYLVAEQVGLSGFKVLLGGQGGDEAFMGYRKYFLFLVKDFISRRQYGKAISLGISLAGAMAEELDQLGLYWRHRSRFSGQGVSGCAIEWPDGLEKPALAGSRQLPQRQHLDISRFSLPTLLRYEDRNSMAHSVETRLPFLDYRLIELGLACPAEYKVRHGYGKWIVRKALDGVLSDEVRMTRRKVGFAVDQARLLAEGLGDELRGWLDCGGSQLTALTRAGFDVRKDFSDTRLSEDVKAMPELISLAWMLRRSV